MARLAQTKLARFGARSGAFERFASNYVLDLLAEAHRLLAADGRLCLVSLLLMPDLAQPGYQPGR